MSVAVTHPLLLAGRPVPGSGATLPVVDPWTGDRVAEVPSASPEQVEAAITASVAAFAEYRREPAHRRAALLDLAAGKLADRGDELAGLIVRETGKTLREARTEAARAVATLRIAAEEAKRIDGDVLSLDAVPGGTGHIGHVRRWPVGPVAAITPFNSPLNLVSHKVGPALAAGNTVLVKPAERTPLSALALGQAVTDAAAELGLPAGIISVVPAEAPVAQGLVTDERVRVLTFTGSAAVGWRLRSLAGTKRVLLELGGNGAAIVAPDADLAPAAARCRAGAFAYAGQVCASVQRIYAAREIFDAFVARLLDEVERLRVGDPTDPGTDMGPMISAAAAERVRGRIRDAVADGATLLAGGGGSGSLVPPTVLTGTRPDMAVACDELFGPVVVVEPYAAFADAVAAANAGAFGLQGSLFTRDVHLIHRAHAELELGSLIVNDAGTWRVDHMPFGGVKASGIGREGVRYAIREQTDERLLVLNLETPGERE